MLVRPLATAYPHGSANGSSLIVDQSWPTNRSFVAIDAWQTVRRWL
jgi:hypothetical protein